MWRTCIFGECYIGQKDENKIWNVSDDEYEKLATLACDPKYQNKMKSHPFIRLCHSEMYEKFGDKRKINLPLRFEHGKQNIGTCNIHLNEDGLTIDFNGQINPEFEHHIEQGDGASLSFSRDKEGKVYWNHPSAEVSLTSDPFFDNEYKFSKELILIRSACSNKLIKKIVVNEKDRKRILCQCSKNPIQNTGKIEIITKKRNHSEYITKPIGNNINIKMSTIDRSQTMAETQGNLSEKTHESMTDEKSIVDGGDTSGKSNMGKCTTDNFIPHKDTDNSQNNGNLQSAQQPPTTQESNNIKTLQENKNQPNEKETHKSNDNSEILKKMIAERDQYRKRSEMMENAADKRINSKHEEIFTVIDQYVERDLQKEERKKEFDVWWNIYIKGEKGLLGDNSSERTIYNLMKRNKRRQTLNYGSEKNSANKEESRRRATDESIKKSSDNTKIQHEAQVKKEHELKQNQQLQQKKEQLREQHEREDTLRRKQFETRQQQRDEYNRRQNFNLFNGTIQYDDRQTKRRIENKEKYEDYYATFLNGYNSDIRDSEYNKKKHIIGDESFKHMKNLITVSHSKNYISFGNVGVKSDPENKILRIIEIMQDGGVGGNWLTNTGTIHHLNQNRNDYFNTTVNEKTGFNESMLKTEFLEDLTYNPRQSRNSFNKDSYKRKFKNRHY